MSKKDDAENDPQSPEKERYLYRVTWDGEIKKHIIWPPQNLVFPDESDALYNSKYPRIRLVDDESLVIENTSPQDASQGVRQVRGVKIDLIHDGDPDFWTWSRGRAKVAVVAFRIGRRTGFEQACENASNAFRTLLLNKGK